MIDVTTQEPLYVSTDGTAGPYIIAPISQLEKLKELLNRRRIAYWVDEEAVSINGKPEIIVINFGRNADAIAIQNILDDER